MFSVQRFSDNPLWGFVFPIAMLMFLLPVVLLSGCVAAPEIDQSLRIRAIEGNAQSQYEIGERYRKAYYASITISSIYSAFPLWEEAAKWYEMAANQGKAKAQYQLSVFFFTFRDDYERSYFWVQKAAVQGLAEAQYSLGMHYAQAWGTPQDLVQAYKWIALAHQGEGGVQDGLRQMDRRSFIDLELLVERGKMSQEQIAEGQRLAAEHTANYGRSRSLFLTK